MYCHKCGQELSNQAMFCPYCGETAPSSEGTQDLPAQSKSRKYIFPMAAVLALITALCLPALRGPSFGGSAIPFEPLYSDEEYTLSFDELIVLAEADHIESQYQLGMSYFKDEHRNLEKAFIWIKKAAEASHAEAMHRLGAMYWSALGTESNYDAAFFWFQKASDAGITCAMVDLGQCYYYGKGTAQNYEEAEKLYRLAFDNGDPRGANFLGIYYYHNRNDLPPDYPEAIKWFETAASLNHPESFTWIGSCY